MITRRLIAFTSRASFVVALSIPNPSIQLRAETANATREIIIVAQQSTTRQKLEREIRIEDDFDKSTRKIAAIKQRIAKALSDLRDIQDAVRHVDRVTRQHGCSEIGRMEEYLQGTTDASRRELRKLKTKCSRSAPPGSRRHPMQNRGGPPGRTDRGFGNSICCASRTMYAPYELEFALEYQSCVTPIFGYSNLQPLLPSLPFGAVISATLSRRGQKPSLAQLWSVSASARSIWKRNFVPSMST